MGTRNNKLLVLKKDPCSYYLIFVKGVPVNYRKTQRLILFVHLSINVYIPECIKTICPEVIFFIFIMYVKKYPFFILEGSLRLETEFTVIHMLVLPEKGQDYPRITASLLR